MHFLFWPFVTYDIVRSVRRVVRQGDRFMIRYRGKKRSYSLLFEYKNKRWFPVMDSPPNSETSTRYAVTFGARDIDRRTEQDGEVVLYDSEYVRVTVEASPAPHWFAVSPRQQQELLTIARQTIEREVGGAVVPPTPVLPGAHIMTVCTAFWTEGKLRGSMTGEGATVAEAVRNSARRALVADERFKPLTQGELADTSIEITVFSPIRVRTRFSDDVPIDHRKGYIAELNGRWGLYVPEVHNATRFLGRADLLRRLFEEKGGISWSQRNSARAYEFDVCDFIEGSPASPVPTQMSATMPLPKFASDQLASIEDAADRSLVWLKGIQEPDGNIPPYIRPFQQSKAQVDWARLPLVAYALSEFLQIRPARSSQEMLQGILSYCERYLGEVGMHGRVSDQKMYGLVYLAHAYMRVGEYDRVDAYLTSVLARLSDLLKHPILSLQVLSLLQRIAAEEKGDRSGAYEKFVLDIGTSCKMSFLERANDLHTDSALFAEAVVAYRTLDPSFSRSVADWLVTHQKSDGSFRLSRRTAWSHTRGTAKIFEVLATQPDRYHDVLVRTHAWLEAMQYTETNTFFIAPSFRKEVIGGMRHDHGNPDVWIDATAHHLLGIARIVKGKGP